MAILADTGATVLVHGKCLAVIALAGLKLPINGLIDKEAVANPGGLRI